jgi:hypothetical protein
LRLLPILAEAVSELLPWTQLMDFEEVKKLLTLEHQLLFQSEDLL